MQKILNNLITILLILFICQLMHLVNNSIQTLELINKNSIQIIIKPEPQTNTLYNLPKLEEY